MKKMALFRKLSELDKRGVYVLARRDLEKLFPEEGEKAMEKSLQRMVADDLLQRVAKGLYVNPAATSKNRWIAEEIAKALRPGSLSYVSLESILSEYGVISQVPVSRMTVMTTGKSGTVETPYGTIEFTHTKRRVVEIIKRTLLAKGRPLRIATKQAAVRDLLRVGRNANMIDQRELDDEQQRDEV
ncbi:MAG: type IV toxin-antitoxin system AbiEi family antitoxin [Zwartia sp.]|jgi:predicted transcriptional regulator of viral defense system